MAVATLANDYVAGNTLLTTKNLHAQSLSCALAAVLRTTNTFFMCHDFYDFKWLSNYFLDSQFGELLTMAVQLAVALATLLVEDEHLVTLYQGRNYLSNNLGALDFGSTYGDGTVVVYQQHSLKLNSLAGLGTINVVYEKLLTGFRAELLTVNLYDCVHCLICLFNGFHREARL